MNVLGISDLHNTWGILDYIKDMNDDYEIVLIAGDLLEGRISYPTNFVAMMEQFQRDIDVDIIITQGNHDYFNIRLFVVLH